MSIESVMPSNHLILCRPLCLLSPIPPNLDSTLESRDIILSTKVCLVKAMVFPVVMHGCESWTIKKGERRRIDSFEVWCWRRLSHPYMTTGKTIALTRQTFVDKIMSLLFNMLPRLVITFLPRSKHLLISWLQSPSAFGAPKNKVRHCFHCFLIYLP